MIRQTTGRTPVGIPTIRPVRRRVAVRSTTIVRPVKHAWTTSVRSHARPTASVSTPRRASTDTVCRIRPGAESVCAVGSARAERVSTGTASRRVMVRMSNVPAAATVTTGFAVRTGGRRPSAAPRATVGPAKRVGMGTVGRRVGVTPIARMARSATVASVCRRVRRPPSVDRPRTVVRGSSVSTASVSDAPAVRGGPLRSGVGRPFCGVFDGCVT